MPGPGAAEDLFDAFALAGRTLFSLGLVKAAEGNLSVFDGRTLVITRTGALLSSIQDGDLLEGDLDGDLAGASTDLGVHRAMYRDRGPGAIVHAHPPGTVPEGGGGPGRHGVYEFAASLGDAVELTVDAARQGRTLRASGRGRPVASMGVPPEAAVRPIEWRGQVLRILDQTRLPLQEWYLEASTAQDVADAIRRLAIRGAPLLGSAAGFGLALEASRSTSHDPEELMDRLEEAADVLVSSRPTAVNVSWAVARVLAAGRSVRSEGAAAIRRRVIEEARRIAEEGVASCRAIGEQGEPLVGQGANVLTHCNTGALATGGDGTAQAVILAAHRSGKRIHVWVPETRPLLQGARLTAWELQRLGVPMTLVADSAAGHLMARGLVDLVIVGADRIAANGDVANKIGTYQLAVLARHHGIPFYAAAPLSTVDLGTPVGRDIVIEERDPVEVTTPFGVALSPSGTAVANPAFDVTPAALITAILTDRGIAVPPFEDSLRTLVGSHAEIPA